MDSIARSAHYSSIVFKQGSLQAHGNPVNACLNKQPSGEVLPLFCDTAKFQLCGLSVNGWASAHGSKFVTFVTAGRRLNAVIDTLVSGEG